MANSLAWCAVVYCVILPALVGRHWSQDGRRGSRLFTIFAFYGFSWAILLPYYSVPPPPPPTAPPPQTAPGTATLVMTQMDETLPALCGFVLFYVGVLLLREANDTRRKDQINGRKPEHQGWVVMLLCMLAVPSGLALVFPRTMAAAQAAQVDQATRFAAGTALSVVGLLKFFQGLGAFHRAVGNRHVFWTPLAAVILLTAGCELVYSAWYALESRWFTQQPSMPVAFKITFAITKIVMTTLFLLVMVECLEGARSSSGWLRRVRRLLGVAEH